MWHKNVLPKYDEFIEPCKEKADVIVENSQSMADRSALAFDVKPVVEHLDQLLHSIDITNIRLSKMRFTLLPKVAVRPIINTVDELAALIRALPETSRQTIIQELEQPSQSEIDNAVAAGNGLFTADDVKHMQTSALSALVDHPILIASMQPGQNGEAPLFRISD